MLPQELFRFHPQGSWGRHGFDCRWGCTQYLHLPGGEMENWLRFLIYYIWLIYIYIYDIYIYDIYIYIWYIYIIYHISYIIYDMWYMIYDIWWLFAYYGRQRILYKPPQAATRVPCRNKKYDMYIYIWYMVYDIYIYDIIYIWYIIYDILYNYDIDIDNYIYIYMYVDSHRYRCRYCIDVKRWDMLKI